MISSGPEIINVPDVTGLDLEDSTQVLEDAGPGHRDLREEVSRELVERAKRETAASMLVLLGGLDWGMNRVSLWSRLSQPVSSRRQGPAGAKRGRA